MTGNHFTCPCCGYRTLDEPPGSYYICPVCFWEDDGVQLLNPAFAGGANKLSLVECQENFRRFGACEKRFKSQVRAPMAGEARDPEWRVVQQSDLISARTPRQLSPTEYKHVDSWYYWKRVST